MSFRTLPSSLDSLENLKTLRLDGCHNLEDIALIGKLTKLQVLSLMGSKIKQLSDEMVQLTNLRLLDLDKCEGLKVIPRNILSNLSRLECLFMRDSFAEWAIEGESSANACLSELSHLSYLTTLYIEMRNVRMLPKDILLDNLKRYAIPAHGSRGLRTDRKLRFYCVNRSSHLGDGISRLLERSEEVEFEKLSGTNYVLFYPSNRETFLQLKHLQVSRSHEIEYIIDSTDQQFLEHGAFPLLESMFLSWLNNLQEVWHGPIPMGSFGKLKTLKVEFCRELSYLFWISTARGLSQLESMTVENCEAMQQIIVHEEESKDEYSGTNLELFPNLQTLILKQLPQLITFGHKVC